MTGRYPRSFGIDPAVFGGSPKLKLEQRDLDRIKEIVEQKREFEKAISRRDRKKDLPFAA